jgi:hypothetical protein
MHTTRTLVATLALVALPVASAMADGPFGVTMGDRITKFSTCEPSKRAGFYNCTTLPKAHPDAGIYILKSHPSTGVCKVGMLSNILQVPSDGGSLRDRTDAIAEQLSRTYGRYSNHYDYVKNTSLTEPRYWMYTLGSEDRSYKYCWTGSTYKNNVDAIEVAAKTASSEEGYVMVWIEFKNIDACDAAIEADKAQAF